MGCSGCQDLNRKLDEVIASWTDERDVYKAEAAMVRAELRELSRMYMRQLGGASVPPAPTDMSGAGTPAQMMMAEQKVPAKRASGFGLRVGTKLSGHRTVK